MIRYGQRALGSSECLTAAATAFDSLSHHLALLLPCSVGVAVNESSEWQIGFQDFAIPKKLGPLAVRFLCRQLKCASVLRVCFECRRMCGLARFSACFPLASTSLCSTLCRRPNPIDITRSFVSQVPHQAPQAQCGIAQGILGKTTRFEPTMSQCSSCRAPSMTY